MSVKLQKERLKLSESVYSRYLRTTVENDIIVPDIKPDIFKILQVSSSVAITHKSIQPDKVHIKGTVRLNILYVPDGAETGTVKSISASPEFSQSVDLMGALPDMTLSVDAECEAPEHTLLNSRKINIRSKIGLGIRLSSSSEAEISVGVNSDEAIELKSVELKAYNPSTDTERDIIIRERLELAAGKPAISEVLSFSAKPRLEELRLSNGKAAVKGELKVSVVYCGEVESESQSSPVEFAEYSIPFNEALEIDGLSENMTGEADLYIKDLFFEVNTDSDGDKRLLSCEFTVTSAIRAYEAVEFSAIEDAYGLSCNISVKKSPYRIERLIDSLSSQEPLKEQFAIPDYLPELKRLCDCSASPSIEGLSVKDGTVTVNGCAHCGILYLTADADMPIASFNHIIPFVHTFNASGINADSMCEAKAEIDHISCTLNGTRALEIRAAVTVYLKAVAVQSVELVSSLTCETAEACTKPAAMVVCFVQDGDTLWDIAKRYRTTPDSIIAANGSEAETIKTGNRLFIFR